MSEQPDAQSIEDAALQEQQRHQMIFHIVNQHRVLRIALGSILVSAEEFNHFATMFEMEAADFRQEAERRKEI